MAENGGRHDCREGNPSKVPHTKPGWIHPENTLSPTRQNSSDRQYLTHRSPKGYGAPPSPLKRKASQAPPRPVLGDTWEAGLYRLQARLPNGIPVSGLIGHHQMPKKDASGRTPAGPGVFWTGHAIKLPGYDRTNFAGSAVSVHASHHAYARVAAPAESQ